jgi:hypothetical protein
MLKELEYRGNYKSCMYKYVEPTTHPSKLFGEFLAQGTINSIVNSTPSRDFPFMRYKPPTEADLTKHLARFAEPRPFRGDLFFAVRTDLRRRLTRLEGRHPDEPLISEWLRPGNLYKVVTESDTSAGLRWAKLGLKSKNDARMAATAVAVKTLESLVSKGETYFSPPGKLAGRGKLVDVREEDGKKDGRLIVVPDMERHLLGSLASKPYTQVCMGVNKSRGGTMIGMGPFGGWYNALSDACERLNPVGYLMIDYSGYDQTVPAEVIQWAFDHIRTYFTSDPGSNAYWASEYDNLVNMDIAMPNGDVYRKRRGVSSGDPWTSQVDSLANWACTTWTLDSLGVDAAVWTFGDDVLVAITGTEIPLSELPARFSAEVMRLAGLEAKMKATYTSPILSIHGQEPVANKSPSFLSNYFMHRAGQIMPARLTEDAFLGLAYPERNYEGEAESFNYEWELGRVSGYYLVYFWNYQVRNLLHLYHDFLITKIRAEGRLIEMSKLDEQLRKLLDIPLTTFLLEWSVRLPRVSEVIGLYVTGVVTREGGEVSVDDGGGYLPAGLLGDSSLHHPDDMG